MGAVLSLQGRTATGTGSAMTIRMWGGRIFAGEREPFSPLGGGKSLARCSWQFKGRKEGRGILSCSDKMKKDPTNIRCKKRNQGPALREKGGKGGQLLTSEIKM